MSVRTLSRVWDASRHGGTELLMLLAIADFADDDGRAYPAVAKLARKCRTTPRHANRLLAALRDSGELEIRLNAGEHGQNRYRILFEKMPAPLTPASPLTGVSPLTPTSATPDVDVPKPLTCTSDKPSLNRQEPSGRRKSAKAPPCPHLEIVATYHDVLPELRRVEVLDSKGRKAAIDEFWHWLLASTRADGSKRANDAMEALQWTRKYFACVRDDDHTMGRTARDPKHENWKAGIEYVLSDKVRTRVIDSASTAA